MCPTTHIFQDQLMLFLHFIIVYWPMVSFRLTLIVYTFTKICERDSPKPKSCLTHLAASLEILESVNGHQTVEQRLCIRRK